MLTPLPLQGGLSCSQPTPLPSTPEKPDSPLLFIFLNVTYSRVTDYIFYFILFIVCFPYTKCKLHEYRDSLPALSALQNIEDSRCSVMIQIELKLPTVRTLMKSYCLFFPHAQDDSWLCEWPLGPVREPQPGHGIGPGALLLGETTGWIWWAVLESCPPRAESQKVRSTTRSVEKWLPG